jgi:hypothetical protein
MKPKGYTVYDIEPVLYWMIKEELFTTEEADIFRDYAIDYTEADSSVIFLCTEDCIDVPGLDRVLNEFGISTWTNRGGVDQYEVYLNV